MPHPAGVLALTTETVLSSDRSRLLSLLAINLTSFGVGISIGVGVPLASLTFEAWNQPTWLIGMLGAIPSLATLLTLPFAPRIAARYGAVLLMFLGCTVAALGFVALYLFQTPEAWLVIRFVMSAALTIPWLLSETWINTVAEDKNRGRIIAVFATSFFAGFAVGPLLLEQTGIEGWKPFAAGALGTFLAAVPVALAARVAPDLTHDGETMSLWQALKLSPLGYIAGLIGGTVEMSCFALLGNVSLAAQMSQDQALWILSLLTIGGGIMQLFIGWYADAFPRKKLTTALCLIFIGLTLLLPWALKVEIVPQVLAFVLGGIVLGFYTVGLAIVGDEVSERNLASANAAFLFMYQIGGIAGPAITGFAMEADPVWGFVWMTCTMVSIGGLLVSINTQRRRPS